MKQRPPPSCGFGGNLPGEKWSHSSKTKPGLTKARQLPQERKEQSNTTNTATPTVFMHMTSGEPVCNLHGLRNCDTTTVSPTGSGASRFEDSKKEMLKSKKNKELTLTKSARQPRVGTSTKSAQTRIVNTKGTEVNEICVEHSTLGKIHVQPWQDPYVIVEEFQEQQQTQQKQLEQQHPQQNKQTIAAGDRVESALKCSEIELETTLNQNSSSDMGMSKSCEVNGKARSNLFAQVRKLQQNGTKLLLQGNGNGCRSNLGSCAMGQRKQQQQQCQLIFQKAYDNFTAAISILQPMQSEANVGSGRSSPSNMHNFGSTRSGRTMAGDALLMDAEDSLKDLRVGASTSNPGSSSSSGIVSSLLSSCLCQRVAAAASLFSASSMQRIYDSDDENHLAKDRVNDSNCDTTAMVVAALHDAEVSKCLSPHRYIATTSLSQS